MWKVLRNQSIFIRSLALLLFEILLFAVITPFLWILGSAWNVCAAGSGRRSVSGWFALVALDRLRFPRSKVRIDRLIAGHGGEHVHTIGVWRIDPSRRRATFPKRVLYYLVFFYLMTLATKTMLTLPYRHGRAMADPVKLAEHVKDSDFFELPFQTHISIPQPFEALG